MATHDQEPTRNRQYSPKSAVAFLKRRGVMMSESTLADRRKRGGLPEFLKNKHSGRIYYPLWALEAYVKDGDDPGLPFEEDDPKKLARIKIDYDVPVPPGRTGIVGAGFIDRYRVTLEVLRVGGSFTVHRDTIKETRQDIRAVRKWAFDRNVNKGGDSGHKVYALVTRLQPDKKSYRVWRTI